MAKRFDETDSFINTVLTEANWSQANIKVKLNEEKTEDDDDDDDAPAAPATPAANGDDADADDAPATTAANDEDDEDDKKENPMESVQLGYDACPLCESSLEDDDVIFENIDTHFNNLLAIVDQAQSLEEGEEFDGNLVVEAVAPDGCCPLCESVVEDDELLLANMNEHFDVVLEMLDELQEGYGAKKGKVTPKKMPKKKA